MEDVSTPSPPHRTRRTVRLIVLTQDVLKLQLIPRCHFRGFSSWGLGDEDPAIWTVLNQQTKPVRDHSAAVPTRQQKLAHAFHSARPDAG